MTNTTHTHGTWNVICDRCGFKKKNTEVKEDWQGLYVCEPCFETRHPLDFERGVTDDPSVPYSRPDVAEAGGTDVDGNTYPPTENTTQTDIGVDPADGTFNIADPIGS